MRSESLCKPDLHVWRRHESERHRRISPHSPCDCAGKLFKDVAHGDMYEIVYFNANGLVIPGTGPRLRGVGKD
jgi:hypothetical protein